MYGTVETGASLRYLFRVIDELKMNYCLIGGWAVHFLVKNNYEREVGKPYLGSQDLDLGFPNLTSFKRAQTFILDVLQFERVSFRYLRELDYDTGREMSQEEARRTPLHMLIHMYIDAMLPYSGADVRKALGFNPPDEPLLERVFRGIRNTRKVKIHERMVTVPKPAFILAMKLNSVGNRTKDHKKIKDICDLTVLSLYSGVPMVSVTHDALSLCDPKKLKVSKKNVTLDDLTRASEVIEIPEETIVALMKNLKVGK
jgi:hypothetical protein